MVMTARYVINSVCCSDCQFTVQSYGSLLPCCYIQLA